MRSRLVLAAVVASSLGPLGCGAALPAIEKDPAFPQYFTRRTPGHTAQARLEGERLHGIDEELQRYGDSFRGHSRAGAIDLHSDGARVDGSIGERRTDLRVTDVDGVLTIQGLVANVTSHFELTPTRFAGDLGTCRYDMAKPAASDVWYVGVVECRHESDRLNERPTSHIAIPADLRIRPADEQAVLLAAFFAY